MTLTHRECPCWIILQVPVGCLRRRLARLAGTHYPGHRPLRRTRVTDVLELVDDRTGEPLTPVQAAKRRWRQEFELRMAAEAAQQKAEAEVRRLQAELERLRREYGERK